jgi:predicted secreted hydrolase
LEKEIVRVKALSGFIVILALALLSVLALRRDGVEVRAQLVSTPGDSSAFARARGPHPFDFPADHGPHPDFQTEWWYFTGNVQTSGGRHFGYQLTFFRRALLPPTLRQERASAWATDQVYLAHFALTDVAGERYRAFERFSRGAAGLAGAQAPPFRVWLEDWQVEESAPGVYRMRASQDGLGLDLTLTDQKGPLLQGDQGYSPKGPERGNASYYYSLTRLTTSGTVQIGATPYPVSGLSWMDHEYSTSALAPDQVGWDWFSLQLDDGSELMVFQIRKQDGSVDPFSSGTFITADGQTIPLSRDDLKIVVSGTWRSPHSGATYPARWQVSVPAANLTLEIAPHLADQELNVSYAYWEGAVQVSGARAGRPVGGNGYVELTGYAASMQNQF